MSVKTYNANGEPIYVGSSKAVVFDNKDPDHKGRVRVNSPVIGRTGFIPCTTPDSGLYIPPDIGDVVRLEFAAGDIRYPIVIGVVNDGPDGTPDTPTVFQRDVPTNRGLVSPGGLDSLGLPSILNGGHSLELDDGLATVNTEGNVTQTDESKGIRVSTFGGHILKMLEEGSDGAQENRIQVSTSGGQVFQLVDDTDPEKQNITIKDAENRTIEVIKETDRIRIRNASGTIFIDVDIANDIIEIDANNVKLGTSAAEAIVRGDTFRALFNIHTHPTPAGPSSPPFQPMDPPSANTHLSDKHKVE